MAWDWAGPGPAARARRILVPEQDRRHPVRSPACGRHNGGEQADHGGAHRGGQVRRPGVRRDDHVRVRQDRGQHGQAGLAAQVHDPAQGARGGWPRCVRPRSRSPPLGARPPPGPRSSRPCGQPTGAGPARRRRDQPPRSAPSRPAPGSPAAAPRWPGCPGRPAAARTRPPGPGQVAAGLRDVCGGLVAHVEQRARVVLADRNDPPHAGHSGYQRGRQRRLVE